MSDYVDGLLKSELPRAVENVGVKMRDVTVAAKGAGAVGGARMFIELQTAIVKGIEEYGALLQQRLGQFDPAHAPLTDADFDKAIASIDALKDQALALYGKEREKQKTFCGLGLPFEEARLTAVVDSTKNELIGLRASFQSRRTTVVKDDDEWVRAADALRMLEPSFTAYAAGMRICERAHNGLIQARAETYRAGKAEPLKDFDVPADFWWAEGHAALEQDCAAGDFSTWIDERIHLRAFGVRFRRADIERLLPPKRDVKSEMAAHSDEDLQVIKRLEAVVPSAALSYDQAIRDLGDNDRISFRGPALELREALREVLGSGPIKIIFETGVL
jgi:hypothetical protein